MPMAAEDLEDVIDAMIGGCCVCGDVNGFPENPIVYCDGSHCSVAVHQACYGIEKVPEGNWYCERCRSQERNSRVRCELCPTKNGALKHTDSGGWAHVVCALYIPEVRFGNVTTMDPIVLSHVPQERFGRNCYLCARRGESTRVQLGACMECNRLGCKNFFHVTCAQAEGLLCEESGHFDNIKYTGYCDHHIRKLQLKDHKGIKFMPKLHPNRQLGDFSEPASPRADKSSASEISRNGPGSIPPVNTVSPMTQSTTVSMSGSRLAEGVSGNPLSGMPGGLGLAVAGAGLTNGGPSATASAQGLMSPAVANAATSHAAYVASLPASVSPAAVLAAAAAATSVAASIDRLPDALLQPASSSVSPLQQMANVASGRHRSTSTAAASAASNNSSSRNSGDKQLKRRHAASLSATAPGLSVAAPNPGGKHGQETLVTADADSGPGVKRLRKTGKRTVKSLLEQVTPVVADTVSSFHLERERHSTSDSPPRSAQPTPASTAPPPLPPPETKPPLGAGTSGQHLPSHPSQVLTSPSPSSSVVQPIPQYQTDVTGARSSSALPVPSASSIPSTSALPGPATLMSGDFNQTAPPATSTMTSATMAGAASAPLFALPASATPWVGPPNPFRSATSTSSAGASTSGAAGNSNSGTIMGDAGSLPSSLEQLLETQWEQGSQFLMEQAQHFDIASLLSCLHQLRQENTRLETQLTGLATRRDHLLAVNARLSIPLTLTSPGAGAAPAQASPAAATSRPSGFCPDDFPTTSGKAIRSPAYATMPAAVSSPSSAGSTAAPSVVAVKPFQQNTVSPGSAPRAASAFAAPLATSRKNADGTSPDKMAGYPGSVATHGLLLDGRANLTQQQLATAFSYYGLTGASGNVLSELQLQQQLAAALQTAYGNSFAAAVSNKTSSSSTS